MLAACTLRRDCSLASANSRTPAGKVVESEGSNVTDRQLADRGGSRFKNFADNASPPGKLEQQKPTPPRGAAFPPSAKAPASGNSSALLETPKESGTSARRRKTKPLPSLSTPLSMTRRGLHKDGSSPRGSKAGETTNRGERLSSVAAPDSALPRRASHGSQDGEEQKNKARLSVLAGAIPDILVDTAPRGSGVGSGKWQRCERGKGNRPSSSLPASRPGKRPLILSEKCPEGGAQTTASRRRKLLRGTAAMGLLAAWATFFGGRTLSRCEDWRSERALFESALRVCPDGIKTLNNLASGMLNVDEAPRAERLLRRAIEVRLG